MPIQYAVELAYALKQNRACDLHRRPRANQIFRESHLLSALRREQSALLSAGLALLVDDAAKFGPRLPADLLQASFGQSLLLG